MLTLESDILALRPSLGDAATDALVARERRDVFSIYPELRICAWLGATMLAAASGIVLTNNLDRIGPSALALGMGLVAAACYGFVTWHRARASVIDDYILLLGALLVSADVAFIESQYHLFDEHWKRHLLLLAVVHAIGAYAYGSRMLLSLSITALAGWLGAGRDSTPGELATPVFLCAALLIGWRELDARLRGTASPPTASRQPPTPFSRTFEHFAATLALTGGLTLLFDSDTRILGALLTIAIAVAVIAWGFRVGVEWFVLYAFLYGVIAFATLLIDFFDNALAAAFIIVVSMIASVVSLLALHARFKAVRS